MNKKILTTPERIILFIAPIVISQLLQRVFNAWPKNIIFDFLLFIVIASFISLSYQAITGKKWSKDSKF